MLEALVQTYIETAQARRSLTRKQNSSAALPLE